MRVLSKLMFAVAVVTCPAALPQTTQTGPSFSCAHVTSAVNKMICDSSELSALDRELANVFNNMRGQPIDQKKLRADEDAWLKNLLHDCTDQACVKSRYVARLSELRDQSLRAASPAAYEETRPFPAPPALMAEAQALVGKACSYRPNVAGPVIPGFQIAPGFLPVISTIGVTVVREKDGTRFAFLVVSTPGASDCKINDVVALPASATGSTFLQCSVEDPALNGFGVRNVKTHQLYGFWSLDADTRKFERVAMGVLGIEKAVRCQQPETAE